MGKDLLHLFGELNQVELKNFKKDYRFISEESNRDSISWVISSKNELINFDELENNPIPNPKN